MAISWPIWQAQLRGIIPTQRPPAFQTPDVANLLYKGISGFGDNIVNAGKQAREEELARQRLALQERELGMMEQYRSGMLGVQQGELDLKKAQQGNWGEMAKGLEGLYGAGGAVAPAGGVGRGGDASSAGPALPSFVKSGGAMSNLDTGTRIYNKLVERNIDPKVAAGLVGNMGVESRFNSAALNPNDKGMPSFGLVQHRGDRAALLHANARRAGKHWSDEDVQVDTIVAELQGSENAAYQAALRAGTPAEAAAILAQKYERPSASALQKSLPERMAVAEAIGRGVPTSRTPGTPPPDAVVPPPAAPTRVASLNPSAGLVPPPMQGTPQPAAPQPPPPLPPPAPPQRQQEQVLPGSPLFPQTPPMQMPQQGPQAGLQLEAAPPAPQPAPPPQQVAQAQDGVREVIPAQTQPLRRDDPRVRAIVAKAMAAGGPEAAKQVQDLIAPEPRSRFTNTELGILDNETGRVVAPAATADGSQGLFKGTSIEGQALNQLVARGDLTVDQALQIAAGKSVTGPNGQTFFFTPQGLVVNPAGPSAPAPTGAPAGNQPAGPGAAPAVPEGAKLLVPGAAKEEVPGGELASRIGLGNEYLGDGLPRIRKLLEDGVLGSAKDRAMYWAGIGKPGEIKEIMAAGQDALLRNLTGAGMGEAEAARYAQRYDFRPHIDSISDLKRRMTALAKHLKVTRDAVLAGRKITSKELKGWETDIKPEEEFERID